MPSTDNIVRVHAKMESLFSPNCHHRLLYRQYCLKAHSHQSIGNE